MTLTGRAAPVAAWSSPDGSGSGHASPSRLPTWPLFSLLALYPLWWAAGLSAFAIIGFALPMAVALRRRRPLRFPPGFLFWGLFLLWVLASVVMVNEDVPNTLPVGGAQRYLSYGLRLTNYLAATVVLLYVGNLTERELPRRRIIRWLGMFFVATVVGGLLGTAFPYLSLPAPLLKVLPGSLRNNPFLAQSLHPRFAQVQDVLGFAAPRPSAPFTFTNDWGNNLSILLIWFVVGGIVVGARRVQLLSLVVLVLAVVPVIYSLNRGLWIGLLLSALYAAGRLAVRGRLGGLAAVAVGTAVLLGGIVATPLGALVTERVNNPHSNEIRASLSAAALEGAKRSPIIGWGNNRAVVGNGRSIGKGRTASCPQCGNRVIGSQGQFWLVIFAQGYVGAAFYTLFFLAVAWRYRRDHSAIGIAGGLAALLPLLYMLVYVATPPTLVLYFVSIGLLWRNDLVRSGIDRSRAELVPDPAWGVEAVRRS